MATFIAGFPFRGAGEASLEAFRGRMIVGSGGWCDRNKDGGSGMGRSKPEHGTIRFLDDRRSL